MVRASAVSIGLLSVWALTGCRDSLTAVERLALSDNDPTVTIAGTIVVESSVAPDTATMVFRMSDPATGATMEEQTMPWNANYVVKIYHDRVCEWEMSVLIWDGRWSEALEIFSAPPDPCEGYFNGPDYWFP